MSHIFRVRELTQAVKDVVEGEFPFVWVRGQVSNLARPGSGHIYFSLKDEDAVLGVVWFKSAQFLGGEGCVHPVTGEVCEGRALELTDGLEVLVAGRLTVYPPRGVYQLVAELVQEQGVGALYLAFEALKRELAEKGYFDEARKMSLPYSPRRVALVTAPGGAAIRDFLRIAGERGTGCEIRVYPTLVQGEAAPGRIAAALDLAGEHGWAEVIVLIRGGGSLEDLWAFNTREVAEAVFRAAIPVLSGVGHEVDTTIADLVADKRAATPSHAAQLLWPERRELAQALDDVELALKAAWLRFGGEKDRELAVLEKALSWLSPRGVLERMDERFAREAERLGAAWSRLARERGDELTRLAERLGRLFGPTEWTARGQALDRLEEGLTAAARRIWERRERELELLAAELTALDPEKPLARGYSLVTVERTGRFLRAPGEVSPGDRLTIRVKDGQVPAVVAEEEA